MAIKKIFSSALMSSFASVLLSSAAFAANAIKMPAPEAASAGSLWEMLYAGGPSMVVMGLVSVAVVALVIYHFKYVTIKRLTPPDFIENLLFLLEKKEYEKAVAICRQQDNMVSGIALKGLQKISKGKVAIEQAIQHEGKERLEKMWQNLSYLGDLGVIAPMLGLLGTIFGMIDAFNFFKAGTVHPGVLTQGLAKAMVNTAAGLVIAAPCLMFYSYFRGRLSTITSTAETAASEIVQSIAK